MPGVAERVDRRPAPNVIGNLGMLSEVAVHVIRLHGADHIPADAQAAKNIPPSQFTRRVVCVRQPPPTGGRSHLTISSAIKYTTARTPTFRILCGRLQYGRFQ